MVQGANTARQTAMVQGEAMGPTEVTVLSEATAMALSVARLETRHQNSYPPAAAP